MTADPTRLPWKVSPRSTKTVRAVTGPKTDVLVATAATAAIAGLLVAQHNAALPAPAPDDMGGFGGDINGGFGA